MPMSHSGPNRIPHLCKGRLGGVEASRGWAPFLPPLAPPYKGGESLGTHPRRPSTDPLDFRKALSGASGLCVNAMQSPPLCKGSALQFPPLCKGRRGGVESSRGGATFLPPLAPPYKGGELVRVAPRYKGGTPLEGTLLRGRVSGPPVNNPGYSLFIFGRRGGCRWCP